MGKGNGSLWQCGKRGSTKKRETEGSADAFGKEETGFGTLPSTARGSSGESQGKNKTHQRSLHIKNPQNLREQYEDSTSKKAALEEELMDLEGKLERAHKLVTGKLIANLNAQTLIRLGWGAG